MKKVTAPLIHDPGRGRPREHLAYLNWQEMQALQRLNGGNMEHGPRGLPSFAVDDTKYGPSNPGNDSYSFNGSGGNSYNGSGGSSGSGYDPSTIGSNNSGSVSGTNTTASQAAGSAVDAAVKAATDVADAVKASQQSAAVSDDAARGGIGSINVGPMNTPVSIGGGQLQGAMKSVQSQAATAVASAGADLRGLTGPMGQPRVQPTAYGTNYQTTQMMRAAYPGVDSQYDQTRLTNSLDTFSSAMPGEADVNRYGGTNAMTNAARVGINQIVGGYTPEKMIAGMDTTGLRPATAGLQYPGPNSLGMTENWADQEKGAAYKTLAAQSLQDALMQRNVSPEALNASNFVAEGTKAVPGTQAIGSPVNGTQFLHDPTWDNRIETANIDALNNLTNPKVEPTSAGISRDIRSASAAEEAVRRGFVNNQLGSLATDPAIKTELKNALGQGMWDTRIKDATRVAAGQAPRGAFGEVSPASDIAGFRTLEQQANIPKQYTGIKNPASGYHTWGMAVDVVPEQMPGETTSEYNNRVGEVNREIAANIDDPAVRWGGNWKNMVDPAHFQYGSGRVASARQKYGSLVAEAGVRPPGAAVVGPSEEVVRDVAQTKPEPAGLGGFSIPFAAITGVGSFVNDPSKYAFQIPEQPGYIKAVPDSFKVAAVKKMAADFGNQLPGMVTNWMKQAQDYLTPSPSQVADTTVEPVETSPVTTAALTPNYTPYNRIAQGRVGTTAAPAAVDQQIAMDPQLMGRAEKEMLDAMQEPLDRADVAQNVAGGVLGGGLGRILGNKLSDWEQEAAKEKMVTYFNATPEVKREMELADPSVLGWADRTNVPNSGLAAADEYQKWASANGLTGPGESRGDEGSFASSQPDYAGPSGPQTASRALPKRPRIYLLWDQGRNIPSPGDPLYNQYVEYLQLQDEGLA